MQKFLFPMEYMRITQGELSEYSHAGSLAMDFGGKDGGSDKLYAPCDMVVKRCRANATGEMYLESIDKVQFADGTADYARLLCIHDSVFNKKAGDVIKQGEYFYDEGGMGRGNPNKFATHVHIEAGKGKWKSTTQSPNSKGTYVCERQEHLYNMFFIPENTVVLNDGGYSWIKEEKEQSDTEKLKAKIAQLEKDLEAEIELRRAYQQENEKLKLKTEKLKSDYNAEKTIRNAYYREYTRFKNKFEQIGNEKVA